MPVRGRVGTGREGSVGAAGPSHAVRDRARKQTGLAVSTASRMEGDFETPVTKDEVKAVEYLALRGEDFGEMTTMRTVIPWALKAML